MLTLNIKQFILFSLRRIVLPKNTESVASSNKIMKVMTVRHPLSRIISLYKDKFNNGREEK